MSLKVEFQSIVEKRGALAPSRTLRREMLAWLLISPVAFVGSMALSQSRRAPTVNLAIATDGDLLAFKPNELTCATGTEVRLTFHHTGKYIRQEHDWVLTLPGTTDEVAQAGAAAGPITGYLPARDSKVLAATRLCGKGMHATVVFIAPAPGDYPFMCTYPGHSEFMRGVLHVTRQRG